MLSICRWRTCTPLPHSPVYWCSTCFIRACWAGLFMGGLMAASNPPKGSVSSSSIKPVTRKAVRCQREVAWLVTQAAGRLVASTEDVNAPTPSFVLAAALDFVRQLELAAQDASGHVDYQNVMAPDLQTFCHMAKLPAAPNALSDAGYMFTLSGADLIRDIYAYCSELAERSVFGTAEVKPGNVIKLVLRLFLMDEHEAAQE